MAEDVISIDVNFNGELCQLCKKGRANELCKVISGDPEGNTLII